MDDMQIINLFFSRNQNAIYETDKKYGKYCSSIANNILKNYEDTRECVNDTYLKVWNSIPPQKPNILKLFLAKITRNLAINLYEKNYAQKRNIEMQIVLDELEECMPERENFELEIEYKELIADLNHFISNLSDKKRKIFLDRYWYLKSIKEISKKNQINESNVKIMLYRMRTDLKKYLIGKEVNI